MNQYKKGVIYTIIGGACWGISGTCGEYLCTFRGMDTRLLTDIRLIGAGIILCLFMAMRYRPNVKLFLRTPNTVLHCIVFGYWWSDVYTVCVSDRYFKNKCRNGYGAAVSVGNFCIADRLPAKKKTAGFAGKHCNHFLSGGNISGGNPW